jgi:hypothetical protein
MWTKWMFEGFSREKLIRMLRQEGTLIGERVRNGRKIYTYLLRDFFVQVIFQKDDPREDVETLDRFADLIQLNAHLEREFKASF